MILDDNLRQMNQVQQPLAVSFGVRCDRGYKRVENQDHVGHFACARGEVFVLADGMGGHKGGSVASQLAVAGFERHFLAQEQLPVQEALAEAARLVNTDVYTQGHGGKAETEGMGSTLVVAFLLNNVMTVGHIGDSRCYLYREGSFRAVTRDHSAVQFMVDAGVLTPEQARNHPDSSVLTRALGQHPQIEMEFAEPIAIAENDVFLICSDGLHGYVQQTAIEDQLRLLESAQATADGLIDLALATGGHDNVSVMVMRVSAAAKMLAEQPDLAAPMTIPPVAIPPMAVPIEKRSRSPWLIGGLATFLALATGGVLALYFRENPPPLATKAATTTAARAELPQAPPVAAPQVTPAAAIASAPRPANAPQVKVRVIIIYPSDSAKSQTQAVLETEKRLSDDGFVTSHKGKIVRDGLVWRMVLPRGAVAAPANFLATAVYLPGYREDAERICALAHCSGSAPTPVGDRDLSMFKENFPRRGVALFMHPGKPEGKTGGK